MLYRSEVLKTEECPGVYMFKDAQGSIIYIGKAKNLRKRLISYFSKNLSAKTTVLVARIASVDTIKVENEVEALLLENNLIKKHQPRYNIALKDSKTYGYIKLTADKFPRILTSRNAKGKGTFFGPYVDGTARRDLIALAVRLFKIRTCRQLPKAACLNYHIGTCTAPCINKDILYDEQVDDVKRFLLGDTEFIEQRLRREMQEHSKALQFEAALVKKRQLESLIALNEKQRVDEKKRVDQDVIAFSSDSDTLNLSMFSVRKGVLLGKKEFSFSLAFDTKEQRAQGFLKAYYAKSYVPNRIILEKKVWDSEEEHLALEQLLSRIRNSSVKITVPKKGSELDLVRLAGQNTKSDALLEMRDMLNLSVVPETVEIFDASNLGSEYLVGAMTRWVGGKIDPSGYRNFRIRRQGEQDDYASICEIVGRRYKRLIDEKQEMPDLIIIDGGPGHLAAATRSLKYLGLQIPIIALAKKNEEIYMPDMPPLRFKKTSRPMLLVRAMRDSVHKRALGYGRVRRRMGMQEEGD